MFEEQEEAYGIDRKALDKSVSADTSKMPKPNLNNVPKDLKSETRVFFSGVAPNIGENDIKAAFWKYGVRNISRNALKSFVIIEFKDKVR